MAEFLTTQGTVYHIENIITSANKRIILVSPYLQLSKTLFERLQDADRKNVRITLVYGKDELKSDERNKLKQLKNLSLRFFKNLHAKCFFNEEYMVITSMNMYEFSEKTNREMGVLISKENDSKVFRDAVREVESIVNASVEDNPARQKDNHHAPKGKQPGYCIRCLRPITLNPEKPYCPDCYEVWVKWEDPNYEENFCHICGENATASMAKPLCRLCYDKYFR